MGWNWLFYRTGQNVLSWHWLKRVSMQIGTCLNTSFLFPSSNSGGGVNEKRKGPEIRSEGEKRVGRKPVSCLLELMPDLPFNNPPIFLKEMLLPTLLVEHLSLFLSLSALSEPVFTFRNILITVIICNLLLAMGPSPNFFPNQYQSVKHK